MLFQFVHQFRKKPQSFQIASHRLLRILPQNHFYLNPKKGIEMRYILQKFNDIINGN